MVIYIYLHLPQKWHVSVYVTYTIHGAYQAYCLYLISLCRWLAPPAARTGRTAPGAPAYEELPSTAVFSRRDARRIDALHGKDEEGLPCRSDINEYVKAENNVMIMRTEWTAHTDTYHICI